MLYYTQFQFKLIFHEVLKIVYLVMANFQILHQLKGYNSCSTKDSLWKFDVSQQVIVIYIYVSYNSVLIRLILWLLNQFKGYNSCSTEASPDTSRTSADYSFMYLFKFYENLFSGYLVVANLMAFKSIQGL